LPSFLNTSIYRMVMRGTRPDLELHLLPGDGIRPEGGVPETPNTTTVIMFLTIFDMFHS
jgi:hypothetical protein